MKTTALLLVGLLLGVIAAPVARATDAPGVNAVLERLTRAVERLADRPVRVECHCR